ncbi:MAG: (d)CMP kinase [Muribaculaceae bacterium]|nr:(d)CMP kinase [Muribaculaceae bacterium]
MKKIIIAIDGFSSSGKSTMARDLARRIGYVYVDSGAMYRAVTLYALRHGMASDGKVDVDSLVKALPEINISFLPAGDDGVQHTLLNGEDVEKEIRSMEVSGMVSPVAAIPEVRHHLVDLQRKFGEQRGIVMDGRDIGTTVFPDAEMKVFVEASPEVRAQRRAKELKEKGETVDYEAVLSNIRERDLIDTTRKESPLTKAPDALILDNDNLTIPQQMDWLMSKFKEIENARN